MERRPDVIDLKGCGINPLEYRQDPDANTPMESYINVLETTSKRRDFDEIAHTGMYNVSIMKRQEGYLFAAIGETLFKYGLPCVVVSLKPIHDDENRPWLNRDFIAEQNSTILGSIVQNGILAASLDYQNVLTSREYTEERREKLVDEFVLRAVVKTHDNLTQNGWKCSVLGVLV